MTMAAQKARDASAAGGTFSRQTGRWVEVGWRSLAEQQQHGQTIRRDAEGRDSNRAMGLHGQMGTSQLSQGQKAEIISRTTRGSSSQEQKIRQEIRLV